MKTMLAVLPVLCLFGTAALAADTEMTGEDPFPTACMADVQKACPAASTDEARWSCIDEKVDEPSDACINALDASTASDEEEEEPASEGN